MRLSAILLAVVVLLAACFVSAATDNVDRLEQMKRNPPPGMYWDEELGVFVFDPPIPIEDPESNLLGAWNLVYYDDNMMHYSVWNFADNFALVKFETPSCLDGPWKLYFVKVAFFNQYGEIPDEAEISVFEHGINFDCYDSYLNPNSDWVANLEPMASVKITPDPFWFDETGDPVKAQWQTVEFPEPVEIQGPEFWVMWEHNPEDPYYPGSHFVAGYYNDWVIDEDRKRSFESGLPCPLLFTNTGVSTFMIRAFGHCDDGNGGAFIDIKPQSCPNPAAMGRVGLHAVAIVGHRYMPLEGAQVENVVLHLPYSPYELAPVHRGDLEELTTPWIGVYTGEEEDCGCHTEVGDEYMDLVFHFVAEDVWLGLTGDVTGGPGSRQDRECVEVSLSWDYKEPGAPEGPDGWLHYEAYDRFRIEIPGDEGHNPNGSGGGGGLSAVRPASADELVLYQNSPNPLRDRTNICFSLPKGAHTSLTVHDVSGRTVATLVNEELSAGTYNIEWNAHVPSGMYFYRIHAGNETAGIRMVVVR